MPAHSPSPPRPVRVLALALALSLAAASCGPTPTAVPTGTPVPSVLPAATSTSAPSEPSATAPPAATAVPTTPFPNEPPLDPNAFAWDDRSVFAFNLTAAEQPVLETLPAATVYHLALTIDPSLTRVQGQARVRYTNQEDVPLDEIVFRLYPNLLGGELSLSALTVDGDAVTPVYAQRDTVMRVPLRAPLAPNATVFLGMDFNVTVPAELERNYGVLAAADGVLALAHFYPYVAVYDDQGWNEELAPEQGDVTYGDASFYVVLVRAPADLVLSGGGTVIDQQRAGGGQSVTYALGPARDFYLAASRDYSVTTVPAGETSVRVYAPAAFAAAAQQAAEYAAAALKLFGERYGPYPYTELDLVTTPTYALGIEYPGIIALTGKLLDPATPDARLLESVTAHEVGHQWFYNLVGNDQLDDPWLDESLAQYATLQYFADTAGAAAAAAYHNTFEARWSRVNFEEIPIGRPVAAYDGAEYSAIVYGRGALFFEALAQAIGQPAFDAFLADYAQTHRWGIATPESLLALAEAHCGCDLAPLFASWVDE